MSADAPGSKAPMDVELSDDERVALDWLRAGNGQKCVHLGAPGKGPYAREHDTLAKVVRALEARELVEVGPPDYFGWRWVKITWLGNEVRRVQS